MRKIPVESYTRTCGYFAITSNTNKGKAQEIKDRFLQDAKAIKERLENEREGEKS